MDNDSSVSSRRISADQRRLLILKAAEELFFEKGYEATSLNNILDKIGGSKRNFYTEFGGKAGLFKELVAKHAIRSLAALPTTRKEGQSFRESLMEFGNAGIRLFQDKESIKLFRIAVMDGTHFPELINMFARSGPVATIDRLTHLLEIAVERQELPASTNCRIAATHFVAMLHGGKFTEVALNSRCAPPDEDMEKFVASVVDLFLFGVLGDKKMPDHP